MENQNTNSASVQNCSPLEFESLYTIQSVLGKGGFGTVYAGVRISDGLRVAIKEVPVNKVLEWSVLGGRSVPLELKLLYSCQSVAGVVRLVDYYDRGDSFLYIMEHPPDSRDRKSTRLNSSH